MTDRQIDEALDPPVDRLKHMRRLLAEHNYYGNPIDDDFAALDKAIAALERQREEIDTLSRMNRALDERLAEFDGQRVPEGCGWCDGPGPLNAEGLCAKCLYPDGPPKGWKLTPRDPKPEMVEAGCATQCNECHADCRYGPFAEIYVAMWDAAPEPDDG